MTHKEKIIATAYTGIMFVDGPELGEVYAYEEEKLGHGVIDIMHANKEFQQKVRNAVREDFLAMIGENEEIKEEEYIDDLALEERAEDYADECWTLDINNFACKDGYIKGATEQKQIDDQHMLHLVDACEQDKQLLIDKACEWLEKNAVKYIGLLFSSHIRDEDGSERVEVRGSVNMKLYDDFRKAMKENEH